MSEPARDAVGWIPGSQAWEGDVVAALTGPSVAGRFWVDLEGALAFVEARRDAGVSLVHVMVKAAAAAALGTPDLHRQYGLFRKVDPASADVGVSVAGDGALAPVVVVREADRKGVAAIAAELRDAARRAREDDRKARSLLDRWLWLVPSRLLRRLLVRLALLHPDVRRKLVGTIQVSELTRFHFDSAYIPMVAELLLSYGVVEPRLFLDAGGGVVARRGAWCVVQASHRKLNGAIGGLFVERLRAALATPEELA